MEGIYKQSKLDQNLSLAPFHLMKNAFWDIPLFDIYQAVVVDDLHQLGGVYKHLLTCVELCTYDKLPLQAVLCIRYFIDFFYHATAKEHTEASLNEMQKALNLYAYYSPIFENYSKMASYICRRDLLFDEQRIVPDPNLTISPGYKINKYTLRSSHRAKASVATISHMDPSFSQFATMIRAYLDTYLEDFDEDGGEIYDKILAHDNYRGSSRSDFALFNFDVDLYAKVLLFFVCQYKGVKLELCIGRKMHELSEVHPTGLPVLTMAECDAYAGVFINDIRNIDRSVSVVPDFGVHFTQFLVNLDVDVGMWVCSVPNLPVLRETNRVHWSWKAQDESHDEIDGANSWIEDDENEEILEHNIEESDDNAD
ncbi:hypothetical protein EC973_005760 [Apophysomyces ossiformis]|uniref:Uncharacterized protein n=1 Tax=Apophysomyces ossiformis TaxID=679940 RepID=A0A8H7EPB2_9FUNG|nr:hypothetical protein EC973_005760 [Apophysomyces ossiformis]